MVTDGCNFIIYLTIFSMNQSWYYDLNIRMQKDTPLSTPSTHLAIHLLNRSTLLSSCVVSVCWHVASVVLFVRLFVTSLFFLALSWRSLKGPSITFNLFEKKLPLFKDAERIAFSFCLKKNALTMHTGKNLCFTEFSTKIHRNTWMAASNIFHIFSQSIKLF